MIIDNKQSYGSNPDIKTVWDCILSYTDPSARVGRMDVVTGFFSIAALHLLYQELSEINSYRMVLGDIHDMKRDEDFLKKAVNLLQGDSNLENGFQLSYYAKNAVTFLKRETVKIVFGQDGIVPHRRALCPVGDQKRVAVARCAQLRGGDIGRPKGKGPEQQGVFHPAEAKPVTVVIEEIERRAGEEWKNDAKKLYSVMMELSRGYQRRLGVELIWKHTD